MTISRVKTIHLKIKGVARGAAILIVPLLPHDGLGLGLGALWVAWSYWE